MPPAAPQMPFRAGCHCSAKAEGLKAEDPAKRRGKNWTRAKSGLREVLKCSGRPLRRRATAERACESLALNRYEPLTLSLCSYAFGKMSLRRNVVDSGPQTFKGKIEVGQVGTASYHYCSLG